ncbi:MAG: TetR/AcrR family transcriptional regulator [Bacteroidia bacterium]|nr:TetR/AcrR family transcriptional regulator [Bacteroidia bacterium]NNF31714.1 TetR/AcrR family transcriptional regulator [Flavobacteriaceae bacterium]NNJ81125.1 TetR/AcrR family transcriptional regulator [Flavobacteriaceae bacterium]NNK55228.1 TetR/AcrR family transcriptional regulator [Flavobacteriaceae bacterium]NNM10223.1 TetR/AcrR family transcriptional regulator [Flavobacteriaceae bacterium]
MKQLLGSLKISVNDQLYLKDPESSQLGRKIIEYSILLIDEIGFDGLTFKKLGLSIGSNESSVYRYFENKHKLLLYLTSWYWGWIEYQLVFETHNISDNSEKLKNAVEIICRPIVEDSTYSHINEVLLNKIVINEFSKSYLTKEVDAENKEGYFAIYKRLVHRLEEMIREQDHSYQYPTSLASTIIETALHQQFLKDHFKSITDCDKNTSPADFLIDLIFKLLNK